MKAALANLNRGFEALLRVLYPPEQVLTRLRWSVGQGNTTDILDYHFDGLTAIRHRLLLNGAPIYESESRGFSQRLPFSIPFELRGVPCRCVVYRMANEISADLYVDDRLIEKVEMIPAS